jgi:hypothetical protein
VAPGDQANHCCDLAPGPPPPNDPLDKGRCSFLYETIEGGPQDDERWRTGANVGCFAYTAGAGLFNYGDRPPANQHPCDEIAFVSLSNQMLLQPNGASFEKDGMLGVGYVGANPPPTTPPPRALCVSRGLSAGSSVHRRASAEAHSPHARRRAGSHTAGQDQRHRCEKLLDADLRHGDVFWASGLLPARVFRRAGQVGGCGGRTPGSTVVEEVPHAQGHGVTRR